MIAFALGSLALFVVGVSQLPPITRWLAPIVIVAFVVYRTLSASRRSCHVWLGVSRRLAPVGGWVAVTGSLRSRGLAAGAAVACWIAGFDIIYATMDIEVDRAQGLHSMPADYGVAAGALDLARPARAERRRARGRSVSR